MNEPTAAARTAKAIRSALAEHLAAGADGPAAILHELLVGSGLTSRRPVEPRWYVTRGLRYYVSGQNTCAQPWTARADVALATPDSLDLYEIKGPGDTLARLRSQVRAYDDTGSRNTLVVDERHAARAHDAVPPAWGIWVSHDDPPVFEMLRAAQPNPSRNVRGLTYPLYRRELLPLAHACRARPGSQPDLVAFFALHARCDVELHERYLRYHLARRKHAPGWADDRLTALLADARIRHAGAQLAFAL